MIKRLSEERLWYGYSFLGGLKLAILEDMRLMHRLSDHFRDFFHDEAVTMLHLLVQINDVVLGFLDLLFQLLEIVSESLSQSTVLLEHLANLVILFLHLLIDANIGASLPLGTLCADQLTGILNVVIASIPITDVLLYNLVVVVPRIWAAGVILSQHKDKVILLELCSPRWMGHHISHFFLLVLAL